MNHESKSASLDEKRLRLSSWQELVDNYRTFAVEVECDVKRVRKLFALDATDE